MGGWLQGYRVPDGNSAGKQPDYARRGRPGISRFVYNLAAATHQFCRRNRLDWPTGHEMAREFNAAKEQDYPFVSEVRKFVAQSAFRNFSNALSRWRNPDIRSGRPKFHRPATARFRVVNQAQRPKSTPAASPGEVASMRTVILPLQGLRQITPPTGSTVKRGRRYDTGSSPAPAPSSWMRVIASPDLRRAQPAVAILDDAMPAHCPVAP